MKVVGMGPGLKPGLRAGAAVRGGDNHRERLA